VDDGRLDRIEARLRTLTILQQRTRVEVERIANDLARLRDLLSGAPPRTP
jgi:hypothetical protein